MSEMEDFTHSTVQRAHERIDRDEAKLGEHLVECANRYGEIRQELKLLRLTNIIQSSIILMLLASNWQAVRDMFTFLAGAR